MGSSTIDASTKAWKIFYDSLSVQLKPYHSESEVILNPYEES